MQWSLNVAYEAKHHAMAVTTYCFKHAATACKDLHLRMNQGVFGKERPGDSSIISHGLLLLQQHTKREAQRSASTICVNDSKVQVQIESSRTQVEANILRCISW